MASTVASTSATHLHSAPAPADTAIDVSALVRRFGEREALRGISVRLGARETLAVFGPNGAGKTTFLRILAALLLPSAGSVRVLDHELPHEAAAVRGRIGFAGHEPLLYRDLTGRENLSFYARLYRVDDAEARITGLLEAAGLTARADDPIRSLSRGTVQRLALCRAVLHRPQLLLLDEPRASLDPAASELVEPLIGRDSGCTRVLVTHDVDRGLAEADRVLCLHEGHQALQSSAAQIDPAHVLAHYGSRRRSTLQRAEPV